MWSNPRMWRMLSHEGGLLCFFDPKIEAVGIRDLTREEKGVSIDMIGSVSALTEEEERESGQLTFFPKGSPHGS